jgi:hypothetical protein
MALIFVFAREKNVSRAPESEASDRAGSMWIMLGEFEI